MTLKIVIICIVATFAAVSSAGAYEPPQPSATCLGKIIDKLRDATPITHQFKGSRAVFILPEKQLYYESNLELDSDGSRFASKDASGRRQDPTGDPNTSLRYPGSKRESVDADAVPYFVLPEKFYHQFGVALGDIAAVIYKDTVEFAIFADIGPSKKLGEGSIALHRGLGHEPIRNGRYHDEGIDGRVITIVFPGSGNGTPQTPDQVRNIGKALFIGLGGDADVCSLAS
jgi:hypothetical protein